MKQTETEEGCFGPRAWHKRLCLEIAVCMMALVFGCAPTEKKSLPPVASQANEVSQQPIKRGLGFGDELTISVWRHDDLNATVKLDQAGAFKFPLIGKVMASGKSSDEVGEEITARLDAFVVSPQVSVTVAQVKSQTAYVFGEVKTPGVLTVDHEISLWETVARCGGFTSDAGTSKILVLRGEDEHLVAIPANMAIAGGVKKPIALEGGLRAGDIVYVPKSSISSIEEYLKHLDTLLTPLLTLQRFIIFTPQVRDAVTDLFQGPQINATGVPVGTSTPQGGEVLTNQSGGVFIAN